MGDEQCRLVVEHGTFVPVTNTTDTDRLPPGVGKSENNLSPTLWNLPQGEQCQ